MYKKGPMQVNKKTSSVLAIFLIALAISITACAGSTEETDDIPETESDPVDIPASTPDQANPPGTASEGQEGSSAGMGDPSGVYCTTIMGYEYEVITGDDGGQHGVCKLPDDEVCDSWDFLIGKCGQEYSYCAEEGYEIKILTDGKDPFTPEYGVCVSSDGEVIGTVSELSGLLEATSIGPPQ